MLCRWRSTQDKRAITWRDCPGAGYCADELVTAIWPDGGQFLLGRLGPTASERIIDPGVEVVTQRLTVDGTLDPDCARAIQRWYGRLGVLNQ